MMDWTGRLISLAVLLQSLEFLRIKPFNWQTMREEVPFVLRPFVGLYRTNIFLRLICAIAIFPLMMGAPDLLPGLFHTAKILAVTGMLLTSWLIAIRWRGNFNGASDSLTMHILFAWLISLCVPHAEFACALYVALQVVLSYFIAGVAKFRQPGWRNGTYLARFATDARFDAFSGAPAVWAWLVIGFELTFPLALLHPTLCVAYICGGVAFHFANFQVFGLNRFFFTWMAGYPALYLISTSY